MLVISVPGQSTGDNKELRGPPPWPTLVARDGGVVDNAVTLSAPFTGDMVIMTPVSDPGVRVWVMFQSFDLSTGTRGPDLPPTLGVTIGRLVITVTPGPVR